MTKRKFLVTMAAIICLVATVACFAACKDTFEEDDVFACLQGLASSTAVPNVTTTVSDSSGKVLYTYADNKVTCDPAVQGFIEEFLPSVDSDSSLVFSDEYFSKTDFKVSEAGKADYAAEITDIKAFLGVKSGRYNDGQLTTTIDTANKHIESLGITYVFTGSEGNKFTINIAATYTY